MSLSHYKLNIIILMEVNTVVQNIQQMYTNDIKILYNVHSTKVTEN